MNSYRNRSLSRWAGAAGLVVAASFAMMPMTSAVGAEVPTMPAGSALVDTAFIQGTGGATNDVVTFYLFKPGACNPGFTVAQNAANATYISNQPSSIGDGNYNSDNGTSHTGSNIATTAGTWDYEAVLYASDGTTALTQTACGSEPITVLAPTIVTAPAGSVCPSTSPSCSVAPLPPATA